MAVERFHVHVAKHLRVEEVRVVEIADARVTGEVDEIACAHSGESFLAAARDVGDLALSLGREGKGVGALRARAGDVAALVASLTPGV